MKLSQILNYSFLAILFSSCFAIQQPESDLRKKWNDYNSRASSLASSLQGEWDIISYQLNDVDAMDSVINRGLNIPIAFGGYETGQTDGATDSYNRSVLFCLTAIVAKTLKDSSQECKTYFQEKYVNRKTNISCYEGDRVKNRKCLSYDTIQQFKFLSYYNIEGNAPYENPSAISLGLPLLNKSVYSYNFVSNGLELSGNTAGIKYYIKLKRRPTVY